MRSSRKHRSRESKSEFATLRSQYHSLHAREREEVIRLLGNMTEPEAARELTELYQECQWRATRLQIIGALSLHPTPRSLHFLFRLAQDVRDIPLAEAAIRSLGQTHHPLAARFLNHFYLDSPAPLRPATAGAIGLLPDRALVATLTQDLKEAIALRNLPLIRNLVLTLGELKAQEALPHLENLIEDFNHRPVVLSALVSLGKIARTPDFIEKQESRFSADLFEYQLYSSARTQIQFRSQWRLEDYLARIFKNVAFHRTLPYELSHFEGRDVREGLRLFAEAPEHFDRLCLALARMDFPELSDWYAEFFKSERLEDDQVLRVLHSLSHHSSPELFSVLQSFAGRSPRVHEKWLETLSLIHPEADSVFSDWQTSTRFQGLDPEGRLQFIGHLENFALAHPGKFSRHRQVVHILEKCLEEESCPEASARALRALGHLGAASPKAFGFVRKQFTQPQYTASCLSFLRHCPEKDSLNLLLLNASKLPPESDHGFLRALRAQKELPAEATELDALISRSLSESAPAPCRREALGLLTDHPRGAHLPAVLTSLHAERSVQLAAIIALGRIGNEQSADAMTRFLEPPRDGSTDESLVGRAIDTLTRLPGLRACRILVDYLKEHARDEEVCEKIVRCLTPPTGASPAYFMDALDDIIRGHPKHAHADGILSLRNRFAELDSSAPSGARVRGPDIAALDRALQETVVSYDELDEAVRSALRAAETPFLHPEMFDENVDKSPSVLEYCKALDMVLEKNLGRRHLFPKLESQIHEFQNAIHAVSLNEPYPEVERVIRALGVEQHFQIQSFPLHKMVQLSQSILSGKILSDRSRTLDGLRAWAIILLLFGRKNATGLKPLIPIQQATDDEIVRTARRLINLQEIRNPAAHRQTHTRFPAISEVRSETFQLLNFFQRIF